MIGKWKGRANMTPARPCSDWSVTAAPIEFRGLHNTLGAERQASAVSIGPQSPDRLAQIGPSDSRPLDGASAAKAHQRNRGSRFGCALRDRPGPSPFSARRGDRLKQLLIRVIEALPDQETGKREWTFAEGCLRWLLFFKPKIAYENSVRRRKLKNKQEEKQKFRSLRVGVGKNPRGAKKTAGRRS